MKRRFWAGLLSFVMLWSLLPASALAANEEAELETEVSTSENSPVQVKKTINGDGTKLTLEAYVTNEVTQTSSTKPLDIVLVLDQSGSMAYNFDGNDKGSPSERCQYAMKQAVNSFIEKATSADGTHNMAIVTFGTDAKVLNSGWTKVDTEGAKALTNAINGLSDKPTGATNVGAGMQKAQELMNSAKSDTNRQKVVIVFTDGVPTTTNEFDTDVANSAITAAKSMKDAGVTVYTVGIFNGANPDQLYGKDKIGIAGCDKGDCTGEKGDYWQYRKGLLSGGDIQEADIAAGNRFLNYLSSNYDASEIGIASRGYDIAVVVYRGFNITENTASGENKGYYLTTTSADGLNTIFQQIIEEISTLEIVAGTDAVLSDTLSEYFALNVSEGTDAASAITAEKWDCTGKDADGNYTWKKADTQPAMTIKITGKTINVTGFNYTENAVTATTKEGVTTSYSGAKLIVTIPIKPDITCTAW